MCSCVLFSFFYVMNFDIRGEIPADAGEARRLFW